MKKLMRLLLAFGLGLGLAACAGSPEAENSSKDSTPADDTTEAAEPTKSDEGKALVVYFSATGNTAEVAEMIAADLDAATFELKPVDPYTDEDLDYSDDASRVSQEHGNLENVSVELESIEVPDWDTYTTVFIGYPIWWGEAAWPVDSFVADSNFTGKTVYPFTTSASSPLGDSAINLAALSDSGQWQEGIRFSSHPEASEVSDWLDSLNLK